MKSKALVYVYTHPYEPGRMVKVVVHPNYRFKKAVFNAVKSFGVVSEKNMEDGKQYRKIK